MVCWEPFGCRDNGLWLRDNKIVVPDVGVIKRKILSRLHDSASAGHGGVSKTIELVGRSFWWPTWRKYVKEYVLKCLCCQKNKSSTQSPAGLLQPLPIPDHAWGSVSMDFITQLPKTKSGKDAIVVFVDRLTKMTHFAAVKTDFTAEQVADVFFARIISQHGFPSSLITD